MPSPRPRAPRWSVLLAFTETGLAARPRATRRVPARMASRCGASTGAWAMHGDVDVLDRVAGHGHDAAGPPRGTRGCRRPASAGRGSGSARPMSPAPAAPEQGVAHGVQDAVAVRVALEAAGVGIRHPAEAAAGARPPAGARRSRCPTRRRHAFREPARSTPSAQARSSGVVSLRLRALPRHGARTGAPRRSTAIASSVTVDAVAVRLLVGHGTEQREAEALRRLGRAELGAVERLHHEAAADALHGVHHRAAPGGPPRAPRPPRATASTSGDVDERPRGVVHEHDAVEPSGACFRPSQHRSPAACSPPGTTATQLAHAARAARARRSSAAAAPRPRSGRRDGACSKARAERRTSACPGELEEGLGARPASALRGRRRRGWRATA